MSTLLSTKPSKDFVLATNQVDYKSTLDLSTEEFYTLEQFEARAKYFIELTYNSHREAQDFFNAFLKGVTTHINFMTGNAIFKYLEFTVKIPLDPLRQFK